MSNYGRNVGYCGYIEVVPNDEWTPSEGNNNSTNSQTNMSRTTYNDNDYKVTNRYTETHKAGDYYTKSGGHGYKQEARATSTVKITDKNQGLTTEYQTKVNVRKTVYPTPSKSYSNKHINYY